MHAQANQRSCGNEAIGGNHYGPVTVYMAKVDNAATASGTSAGWFKVSEGGLMSNNPNWWAVQTLNVCLLRLSCFFMLNALYLRPTVVTGPSECHPTSRQVTTLFERKLLVSISFR